MTPIAATAPETRGLALLLASHGPEGQAWASWGSFRGGSDAPLHLPHSDASGRGTEIAFSGVAEGVGGATG